MTTLRPALLLSESQVRTIATCRCSHSPLFLRRLVDGLVLAFAEGMDVKDLLDSWVSAASLRELIQVWHRRSCDSDCMGWVSVMWPCCTSLSSAS